MDLTVSRKFSKVLYIFVGWFCKRLGFVILRKGRDVVPYKHALWGLLV